MKTRWIYMAIAALLIGEAFVFLYLRPEKSRWESSELLALNASEDSTLPAVGYRLVEQADRLEAVESQLSYSDGFCGVFVPEAGVGGAARSLDFFYFEYEPGNPRFIHDVFGHAPEVCMKATGATLVGTHPSREIEVDGDSFVVRVLEFKSPVADQTLWIFKLTWLPEAAPYKATDELTTRRREKVLAALFGDPRPPARVLLAGARNYENLDAAWASFEKLLVTRLSIVQPG
ncbi:MAG: hypothetical protein AAF357_10595 [Verrucomicrobiota bacterium]